MNKPNIAIFASGSGTNFEAIHNAIKQGELGAKIVLLVCDKQNAAVINKAKLKQIPVLVFSPKDYESKKAYEQMIIYALREYDAEWLVLAGFMRLLGPELLEKFPNKIVNIHPSLLPLYKGKDAIKQAVDAGETTFGVSIHYVDMGMDTGEIIAQQSFSVENGTTIEQIETQVHEIEHQLFPKVLKELFEKEENM